MEDLIKALQIFLKYGNPSYPTHCEHDEMFICGIDPDKVSDKDKVELEKLGFDITDGYGDEQFHSFKYGSA
jgi:hypothetical protein